MILFRRSVVIASVMWGIRSNLLYEKKNPTHQVLSKCCPKTTTAIHIYNIA